MAAIWERQEGESAKAFHAFTIYRDLPPKERTQVRVAEMLGVSPGNVERWAAPRAWNWAERAAKYDAWRDNMQLTVREADTMQAQQDILRQEGIEVALLSQIAAEAMVAYRQGAKEGHDMLALTRLVNIVERVQTMRRRNVNLPSTYTTKMVDDEINETPVYYAQPEDYGHGDKEEDE